MPGKRLRDPSLTRTNYTEAVTNGAEILTDWDGLVWARPIPLNLVGNSWWQGSYDNVTYSDKVEDDHTYARLSTDGGIEWIVFKISSCNGTEDSHPPVTIGTPDGGLSISGDDSQILTLSPATVTATGSLSPTDKIRIDNINWYDFYNLGSGEGLFAYSSEVGDLVDVNFKSLVAGTGVTLTANNTSITIDATGAGGGEVNTASNAGTDGEGVFYQKNGVDLEFYNVAVDALDTKGILSISLDAAENDIDFLINETLIDHDVLDNYVPNEHIDHSTVSILTEEGIIGGGDLTATRTLTLSFDTLTQQTNIEDTDRFAFYRNSGGEDEHFQINYADFKTENTTYYDTVYVPLTTGVYGGLGLSGGGTLDVDQTLYLDINGLPVVPYDANDYVAVYDTSNLTHGKVTLQDLIGELSVSISEGNGMDFTTITSTGLIDMATPLVITESTTNNAGTPGTGHTHEITLANLTYITDVDASPTSGEYLKWNGSTWVTDDPSIGAATPGLPLNSLQFNNSNVFTGDAGLLYFPDTDSIQFTDPNDSNGSSIIFGDTKYTDPTINFSGGTAKRILLHNNTSIQDYIQLRSGRVLLGDPNTDGDSFLEIADGTEGTYDNLIRVSNINGSALELTKTGSLYLPQLSSATSDNVLYIDETTGLVTYGAKPIGTGGIQTLEADSLSGLMVNGGNTSSAATIELDQNDSKLIEASILTDDYLGFYDVSTGLQSKTQVGNLPGWLLNLNSVNQDEIKLGNIINFEEGDNMSIAYNDTTNTLTFTSTTPGLTTYEDIAFEFADVGTGVLQYTLDIQATFSYNIVNTVLETDDSVSGTISGGSATITYTNVGSLEEITTTSSVSVGDRIYLNITAGHSASVIRGKLVIQRT